MKQLCFAILFYIAITANYAHALDEDWLTSDDFLASEEIFDQKGQASEHNRNILSWRENTRITAEQVLSQSTYLNVLRSSIRLEYEVAPWQGAYLRFDNKYTYYEHGDSQLNTKHKSFGHNKLQDAWLQLSESACVAKLGRQSLYWGNIEGAFAVDVITPFDFTEPLLTDYYNIRLSQNMLITDCYYSKTQVQFFYVESARINQFQLTKTENLDALEDSLNDEWGFKLAQSWEGLDVSLMYAHLYNNNPLTIIDINAPEGIRLSAERYELFGASGAWAIERLLLEFDIAYKKNVEVNFTGKKKSHLETAFGFEYTTSNNHQLNAGIWVYDQVLSAPNGKQSVVQTWSFGWNKSYLKDDLMMSVLGIWIDERNSLTTTVLAQYQWDDYWHFSSALSYIKSDETTQSFTANESGFTITLKTKVEF